MTATNAAGRGWGGGIGNCRFGRGRVAVNEGGALPSKRSPRVQKKMREGGRPCWGEGGVGLRCDSRSSRRGPKAPFRGWGGGGAGTCLSGGGGPGGSPPPPAGTYPIHRQQKNYWRMNNSAHGNVWLSAVNKRNSPLNVNSGFPHLTNTQQLQQSRTFTISCQMTVITLVSQN